MFKEPVDNNSQLLGKTQRFLLEFITILYFIVKNASIPLVQQYVYFLVDKKYNFTAQRDDVLHGDTLEKVFNAVHYADNAALHRGANTSQSSPPVEDPITRSKLQELYDLGHKCNEESSLIVLYLNIAELLPSAIVVLFLGAYSDIIGRRKFLMWMPCLGNAFYALGFVLPLYVSGGDIDHPATKSLFVVAAIMAGLCGNVPTFMAGNASYISDTDTPRRRTLRLAIVEMIIGLTFGISNFAYGFWIRATDHFEQPLWFLFACSIITLLIIMFLLKEPTGEITAELGHISNTLENYKGIKHLFGLSSIPHKKLWSIFLAFTIFVFVQQGQERTFVLFLQSPPLYYGAVQIGSFFLVTYVLAGLVCWPGVPLMQRCLDDVTICCLGLISKVMGSFLMAFATEDYTVYLASVAQMAHLVPFAVARSVASLQVGDDEQGSLYALIHSAQAVVTFFGPLVHNAVYAGTARWMSGFVFLVSGPLLAIPVALLLFMKYLDKKDLGYDSMDEDSVVPKTHTPGASPLSETTSFVPTGTVSRRHQGEQGFGALESRPREIDEYSQDG